MSAKITDTSRHAFANTLKPEQDLAFDNTRHVVIPALLNCFNVIDHASTKFQVKIKEAALHISWEQTSLHKQLYHVNLTLSF